MIYWEALSTASPRRGNRLLSLAGEASGCHVLVDGAIADRLKELLHQKANKLSVTVEGLDVLPDHVHLFVAASPTDAPQYLANQFKGYTARVLRDAFPGLKTRLPSLWSRSYYVGSAGHVSADTIQQYIEQQQRSWTVHKAFKYRLYPTRQQAIAMSAMLETHRRLYNDALAERKQAWEQAQRSVSYGEQSGQLKATRKTNSFLAAINFSSCQATLRRLDTAFQAFFRRVKAGETAGYMRFKGRNRFDTVEFPSYGDGCRFDGCCVYFQHIDG